MASENPTVDQWYSNPYVWLMISIPLATVIAGIFTVIIAVTNTPDIDMAYKKQNLMYLPTPASNLEQQSTPAK